MKILIAIPTNKYIEPETMKSIYDLAVPDGYETDFQYFYGYRVDQIRNLIAEWGKRYDYTFFVDSDIVLPKFALTRLLHANKPIISGMYIQRKENKHILELYDYDSIGGLSNIDVNLLTKKHQEIGACGFGCVLVKRAVFEKISYPHFAYKPALDHKNTVSEDVYFCKKAKTYGFTTWVDTTVKCEHIGQTKFIVNNPESHLEKIAKQDLLPKEHFHYLKHMRNDLHIYPKIIYDIGACVLHWTNKAQLVWPNSEILLFDAAQSVKPFFEKSGRSWSLNVLSDVDGKLIDFYEDPDNPGGNSYYKETTGFFTEKHKTKRKTWKLDTVVDHFKWPLPDLIKMDIQGAELDVINGASKCLMHAQNVILEAQHVDYNEGAPKARDVISHMQSCGFKLVGGFSGGIADADYHFTKN